MKRKVLVLAAALAGCGGEPTIDASGEDTLKASLDRISESLPPEQRREFSEALQVIMFSDSSLAAMAAAAATDGDGAFLAVGESLHGKSADGVIAQAAQMASAAQDRRRRQLVEQLDAAKAELAALVAERERGVEAAADMAKFSATDASVSFRNDGFQTSPVLEMTVKNATEHAISRAAFSVVVTSPGRSVPWTTEQFSHRIPGGVEPGEEQSWVLVVSTYGSSWHNVPVDRDDISLALTTIELEDASGENMYPLPDEDRLSRAEARLVDRIADLQADIQ